jgi:lambda family phage portal protein
MAMFDWFRRMLGRPARRDNYAATYGSSNNAAFAGGAVGRLTASMANWSGSVNADLDGSLVVMRARGRQLGQSNEYGRRFLALVANNIVGPKGPTLQVRAYNAQVDPKKPPALDKVANDAIEIHYARWCKKADITGRMHLAHLYRVAAKAVARDGEALVRIVRDRSLPYGMAVQLLEADRLDETVNGILPNGCVRQGVELDTMGRPVALYIKSRHPGDRYGPGHNAPERVPMDQVRHVYLPERAEQVRGYTWFHAIIVRAMQLHGFNDAAVTAARIGASKVAALERTEESAQGGVEAMADAQTSTGLQMNVEAGEMFELPPGYKLSAWNPEYPHANFESFVKAAMRGISSGLDVATHNLSGDMTDVNYSSARIAELSEREQWMVLQDWFIGTLVEPIYQEWLAISLLRGDITFPQSGKALPADKLSKFLDASRFQGRRWSWVDPAKEIQAKQGEVDLRITSRTRIAAERGYELEDILDELAQEEALMEKMGLATAPAPKPTAAPAQQPPESEE